MSFRTLRVPELALENEHLQSECEDLTVAIIGHQPTNEGGEGREEQECDVAEHDPGSVPQLNDVKGQKALSSEAHRQRRSVLAPHEGYRHTRVPRRGPEFESKAAPRSSQ